MISAITISIGTLMSKYGLIGVDVIVEKTGVRINLFAPPIGRGNGGLISLSEEEWVAFKNKLAEVDANIARIKREHGLVKT